MRQSFNTYLNSSSTTFLDLIAKCERAIDELTEESKSFADNLGLDPPKSIAEEEWLARTGELLLEGPGVPTNWLLTEEFDKFVSEAKRYCTQWVNWRQGRSDHLFHRSYKAILIDTDVYLQELTHYTI